MNEDLDIKIIDEKDDEKDHESEWTFVNTIKVVLILDIIFINKCVLWFIIIHAKFDFYPIIVFMSNVDNLDKCFLLYRRRYLIA